MQRPSPDAMWQQRGTPASKSSWSSMDCCQVSRAFAPTVGRGVLLKAGQVTPSCVQPDESLRADKEPHERGWFADKMAKGGPSLLVAFICTKALLPVRAPLTIAITPPIARYASLRFVECTCSFVWLQAGSGSIFIADMPWDTTHYEIIQHLSMRSASALPVLANLIMQQGIHALQQTKA